MLWVIVVGWIVCGVLAYGLTKGTSLNLQERCQKEFPDRGNTGKYSSEEEGACLWFGSMGPLGLMLILGEYLSQPKLTGPLKLCYRMPKEYCR